MKTKRVIMVLAGLYLLNSCSDVSGYAKSKPLIKHQTFHTNSKCVERNSYIVTRYERKSLVLHQFPEDTLATTLSMITVNQINMIDNKKNLHIFDYGEWCGKSDSIAIGDTLYYYESCKY